MSRYPSGAMSGVSDLSPGTILVAGFTGDHYRVRWNDGDRVALDGPHGSTTAIPTDEIQRDIASGKIGVIA